MIGPIKYRPHYMSNNKQHAGRIVVNKYAKGKTKYEHHETSNKSDDIDDKYMEDIDENTGEWDKNTGECDSFHNIKNEKQKYHDNQISLIKNWKSIIPTIFNSIIEG